MSAPSSEPPCCCPEDAVSFDCSRHQFMWDWAGQDPFKSRLREYAYFNGATPS